MGKRSKAKSNNRKGNGRSDKFIAGRMLVTDAMYDVLCAHECEHEAKVCKTLFHCSTKNKKMTNTMRQGLQACCENFSHTNKHAVKTIDVILLAYGKAVAQLSEQLTGSSLEQQLKSTMYKQLAMLPLFVRDALQMNQDDLDRMIKATVKLVSGFLFEDMTIAEVVRVTSESAILQQLEHISTQCNQKGFETLLVTQYDKLSVLIGTVLRHGDDSVIESSSGLRNIVASLRVLPGIDARQMHPDYQHIDPSSSSAIAGACAEDNAEVLPGCKELKEYLGRPMDNFTVANADGSIAMSPHAVHILLTLSNLPFFPTELLLRPTELNEATKTWLHFVKAYHAAHCKLPRSELHIELLHHVMLHVSPKQTDMYVKAVASMPDEKMSDIQPREQMELHVAILSTGDALQKLALKLQQVPAEMKAAPCLKRSAFVAACLLLQNRIRPLIDQLVYVTPFVLGILLQCIEIFFKSNWQPEWMPTATRDVLLQLAQTAVKIADKAEGAAAEGAALSAQGAAAEGAALSAQGAAAQGAAAEEAATEEAAEHRLFSFDILDKLCCNNEPSSNVQQIYTVSCFKEMSPSVLRDNLDFVLGQLVMRSKNDIYMTCPHMCPPDFQIRTIELIGKLERSLSDLQMYTQANSELPATTNDTLSWLKHNWQCEGVISQSVGTNFFTNAIHLLQTDAFEPLFRLSNAHVKLLLSRAEQIITLTCDDAVCADDKHCSALLVTILTELYFYPGVLDTEHKFVHHLGEQLLYFCSFNKCMSTMMQAVQYEASLLFGANQKRMALGTIVSVGRLFYWAGHVIQEGFFFDFGVLCAVANVLDMIAPFQNGVNEKFLTCVRHLLQAGPAKESEATELLVASMHEYAQKLRSHNPADVVGASLGSNDPETVIRQQKAQLDKFFETVNYENNAQGAEAADGEDAAQLCRERIQEELIKEETSKKEAMALLKEQFLSLKKNWARQQRRAQACFRIVDFVAKVRNQMTTDSVCTLFALFCQNFKRATEEKMCRQAIDIGRLLALSEEGMRETNTTAKCDFPGNKPEILKSCKDMLSTNGNLPQAIDRVKGTISAVKATEAYKNKEGEILSLVIEMQELVLDADARLCRQVHDKATAAARVVDCPICFEPKEFERMVYNTYGEDDAADGINGCRHALACRECWEQHMNIDDSISGSKQITCSLCRCPYVLGRSGFKLPK